ncbi:MAG: DUF4349 domain-containing protein [Gammaproteobacteria bacterium]
MRRFWAVIVMAAALPACSKPTTTGEEASAPAFMDNGGVAPMMTDLMETDRSPPAVDGSAVAQAAPAAVTATPPPNAAGPNQPSGPAPVLYLAYSYAVWLELPSERLASVMDRHVQACQTAGPRRCQLIDSARSGDPESSMEGNVSLRGEPAWLNTFKSGMEQEAAAAGGRVVSESTNSEDLTRQIVDTEARLRAQTALRDRLQELLRSRPGRLADLLEVERELARVQSEIDSVQSALAVMRTRVAMSELNLRYRSAPRPVGSQTFEPLRQAFANFLGVVVGGFAAIVYVIAALIPFAIVFIPIGWLLLRWRRSRGGRFFDKATKPTPEA